MGYLGEAQFDPSFSPFAAFREHFGFVPRLFRAQTLLPRVIEAEAALTRAVLLTEQALSRIQKECILLILAAAHRNTYCVTAHYQMLYLLGVPEEKLDRIITGPQRAGLSSADVAMLDFALKLGRSAPFLSRDDVAGAFQHGWTDESVLEAILTTALATFLCTLAAGLGVAPDFPPKEIPPTGPAPSPSAGNSRAGGSAGPYLRTTERSMDDFAPFVFFREKFGFVPNIFRAQGVRPDVLEAEAAVVRAVLLIEDVLTRKQKECILLVVSAANLNTYCVAVSRRDAAHNGSIRGRLGQLSSPTAAR
jgi:uncharacterized peroxidase-related enzyme